MVELHLPKTETRAHRFVTLSNGIRTMLVSDTRADRSAAAVSVRVGYFNDPVDMPGLHHFIEHLLFLGSEKYPVPDAFNEFCAANGGSTNAYTSAEETVYFFSLSNKSDPAKDAVEGSDNNNNNNDSNNNNSSISSSNNNDKSANDVNGTLQEALRMFAAFFTCPNFNTEHVERERLAVHSEHEKNIQNDSWRRMQLIKETSDKGDLLRNPFAKFGTGNMDTLGQEPDILREAVVRAHARGYDPLRTTMCLVSKEPLDTLEAMILEAGFQNMTLGSNDEATTSSSNMDDADSNNPCGGGVPPGVVPEGPVFSADQLGILVRYAPVKDKHIVQMSWELPSLRSKWRTKPANYLSHLLGHEGVGSLLSSLKARGLADELSAGTGFNGNYYAVFSVTVTVPSGAQTRWREIADSVFAYVDLIDAKGVESWIFEECKALAEIDFEFREKSTPAQYAGSIAPRIHLYPPEEVAAASDLHFNFSPPDIRDVLSILKDRTKVRISICDPSLLADGGAEESTDKKTNEDKKNNDIDIKAKLTKTEPIYGIPYDVQRIPNDILSSLGSGPVEPRMDIPKPNPFIARDLDDIPPEGGWEVEDQDQDQDMDQQVGKMGDGKRNKKRDYPPNDPKVVFESPRTSVFHLADTRWRRPKATIRARLLSAEAYASPRASVLSKLFVAVVEDALTEVGYDAELAGLTWSISQSYDGFYFTFKGYRDRLLVLVEHVLKVFGCRGAGISNGGAVGERRFEEIRDKLARDIRNTLHTQPYQRSVYELHQLLVAPRWHIDEYDAIFDAGITLGDVEEFSASVLAEGNLSILIHGNGVDHRRVRDVFESSLGDFKPIPDSKMHLVSERVVSLSENSHYVTKVTNRNPKESNVAVIIAHLFSGLTGEYPGSENENGSSGDALRTPTDAAISYVVTKCLETAFFRQLRTEEQLGYVVFATRHVLASSSADALVLGVQSSDHSAKYLLDRIRKWVSQEARQLVLGESNNDNNDNSNNDKIKAESDDLITTHLEGARAKFSERDPSRSAETSRVWGDIASGRRRWRWRREILDSLDAITHEDVRKAFVEWTKRSAAVAVTKGESKAEGHEENVDVIEEVAFDKGKVKRMPVMFNKWK